MFKTLALIKTIKQQMFQKTLIPPFKSSQRCFGPNFQGFLGFFLVYFYWMTVY